MASYGQALALKITSAPNLRVHTGMTKPEGIGDCYPIVVSF